MKGKIMTIDYNSIVSLAIKLESSLIPKIINVEGWHNGLYCETYNQKTFNVSNKEIEQVAKNSNDENELYNNMIKFISDKGGKL